MLERYMDEEGVCAYLNEIPAIVWCVVHDFHLMLTPTAVRS